MHKVRFGKTCQDWSGETSVQISDLNHIEHNLDELEDFAPGLFNRYKSQSICALVVEWAHPHRSSPKYNGKPFQRKQNGNTVLISMDLE